MRYEIPEKLILELLGVVKPKASVEEEVRDFVDHDEYGLALEYLVYAMITTETPPSSRERKLLRDAAASMQLDPRDVVREMAERAVFRGQHVVADLLGFEDE